MGMATPWASAADTDVCPDPHCTEGGTGEQRRHGGTLPSHWQGCDEIVEGEEPSYCQGEQEKRRGKAEKAFRVGHGGSFVGKVSM